MTNHINEQYKIKIYCTSRKDLTLNNYSISSCTSIYLKECLKPYYYSYISEIYILTKSIIDSTMTISSLEIFCNRLISTSEFINFINNMYWNGFRSRGNKIEFINTQINKIIYRYDFVNVQRLPINNKKLKKNTSNYSRYRIFP